MGVDVEDAIPGARQLQPADVLRAVDDLPLQIGVVDHVVVDQAQAADAGRGQIHRQRRAKAARADEQHRRRLQLLLPAHTHFGHDQMAAVALDLLVRQRYIGQRGRVYLVTNAHSKSLNG